MARTKGNPNLAFAFEGTGQKPLDARLVVETHADLMNAYQDAANGNNVYDGMPVVVVNNGNPEMWVLKDKAAYLAVAGIGKTPDTTAYATYWQRMDAGGADLSQYLTSTQIGDQYATKLELGAVQNTAQNAFQGLDAKADKTDTYTKTEVDTALEGKAPVGVSEALNSLLNKVNNQTTGLDATKAIADNALSKATASESQLTNLSNKVDGIGDDLSILAAQSGGFINVNMIEGDNTPRTLTEALDGLMPLLPEDRWNDEQSHPAQPATIGFIEEQNGSSKFSLYTGWGDTNSNSQNWRRVAYTDEIPSIANLATTEQLAAKANSADVYTKSESYRKAEVDAALAAKMDSTHANDTFATKQELTEYEEELDGQLALKLDAAAADNFATKEEVGAKLDITTASSTYAPKSDITEIRTTLTNQGRAIGDENGGLVKDVADNAAAIEAIQTSMGSAETFTAITTDEITAMWNAANTNN